MPLRHSRTAKGIKANIPKNIRTEMRAGRPYKQSVAIALSTAARDARKAHVKPKGIRPRLKKRS